MKKTFILLLFVAILSIGAKAQTTSPAVKDLRELVLSAQTNFVNDIGEKFDADTVHKMDYYKTKKTTAGAKTFIAQQLVNKKNIYVIRYDVKNMSTMMLTLVSRIVTLYVKEMNDMVASGNYTGRDYKDKSGDDVTEINDKAGNHIMDYISTSASQSLYIFGLNAK